MTSAILKMPHEPRTTTTTTQQQQPTSKKPILRRKPSLNAEEGQPSRDVRPNATRNRKNGNQRSNSSSSSSSMMVPMRTPSRTYSNNNNNNKSRSNLQQRNSGKSFVERKAMSRSRSNGSHQSIQSSATGSTRTNRSNNNNNNARKKRVVIPEVDLLLTSGTGETTHERGVIRMSCHALLSYRMQFVEAPAGFQPFGRCDWSAEPDRRALIQTAHDKYVAEWKPLMVSEETRWKSKVMRTTDSKSVASAESVSPETTEDRQRKAVAILNKLSWTTLDRLTIQFLQTLNLKASAAGQVLTADQSQLVQYGMQLVLRKAQGEPHFAELYARFVLKLSAVNKAFSKALLGLCRTEFETICSSTGGNKTKRENVGLVKFLGELCKLKLIKDTIIMQCVQRLLVTTDEEKLEYVCQLLTTAGAKLSANKDATWTHLWRTIAQMAGRLKPAIAVPSSRIKFLLQDLIELKEKGWVLRRKEEKAKTIAEIHAEVEEEEKSLVSFRSFQHQQQPVRNGAPRSQSFNYNARRKVNNNTESASSWNQNARAVARRPSRMNRSRADSGSSFISAGSTMVSEELSIAEEESLLSPGKQKSVVEVPRGWVDRVPSMMSIDTTTQATLSLEECNDKVRGLLKEFRVNGDLEDAIMTLTEWIARDDRRATVVVRAGVSFVLEEGTATDIKHFVDLIVSCWESNLVSTAAIQQGLQEPMALLPDIELDAPKAGSFLADMIAAWMKKGCLSTKLEDIFPSCKPNSSSVSSSSDLDGSSTDEEDIAGLDIPSPSGRLAQLAIEVLRQRDSEEEPSTSDLLTILNLTIDAGDNMDMEQITARLARP